MTLLLAVQNLGTWDPYLPKTEETLKHKPRGSTSTENNRCIKCGMVVKGRNKIPEKDDL